MRKGSDPSRRSIPFKEWPDIDKEAWIEATADGDIFDGRGPAFHWADRTKETNIQHYGRWLGYLAWRGQLNPTTEPGARVTIEVVGSYHKYLETIVAPRTRLSMLVGLKVAIKAMVPDEDWRWLQNICNRIQRNAKPKRDRLHNMPSSLDLHMTAHRALENMPSQIIVMADAVKFRDALMLALLVSRPLRVKNFTYITLDKHLIKIDDTWHLNFSAHEVKNKQPLSFTIPEDLIPYLERYLKEVRPIFRDAGTSQILWLNQDGDKLGKCFVHSRIKKITKQLTGTAINPQLFRHSAATWLAVDSSSAVQMSTPLLGHRHRSTTEKYYILAGNLEASRRLNQLLESAKQKVMEE
ncbi:MAG TPA: site-specific integrase [Alphaproteobacteria bacterium]|nr:hypothetical protein [Rhodospirillaceae bacterium]HRJ13157.1 site-specific integrase [Alphaproteobacteria bacterium]